MSNIGVLGGGASGLTAAVIAARSGAKVTLIEKMDRVGKKILATGNGRCNYTNVNISAENYNSSDPDLIKNIFTENTFMNVQNFFMDMGIHPFLGDKGKVYPHSLQSSSVLDVLRYECERLSIKELCNKEVVEIKKNNEKFNVHLEDGEILEFDKVICSFGGKAGPQYGSTGEGYRILERLGHTYCDVFPGLVQLKTKGSFLKKIQGVKFEGKVSLCCNDRFSKADYGEILFTNYGLSGPPILQLSREAVDNFIKKREVSIEIDMFPEYSELDLYEILEERTIKMKYKTIEESLIGLINKKLIPVILEEAKISDRKIKCTKLTKKQFFSIVNILKNWKNEVIGYNEWHQAQITAGGIILDEININTMESKLIKNLYITGEILDVDGDCGGYNLHWAWITGMTAGKIAAE